MVIEILIVEVSIIIKLYIAFNIKTQYTPTNSHFDYLHLIEKDIILKVREYSINKYRIR